MANDYSNNNSENELEQPNYTQIPNVIFDYWMAVLDPYEFKVLLCMCRKIFGWHKFSDNISKNQIIKMTGICKNTVQKAIEKLEEYGLVEKEMNLSEEGNKPNTYRLRVKKPKEIIDEDFEIGGGGSSGDPGGGHVMTQGVGHGVTPQKKDSTKENVLFCDLEKIAKLEECKVKILTGGTQQVKVSSIITETIANKLDFSPVEIETAFKILSESKKPVSSPFLFIKGTIENLRKQNKNNQKETKPCTTYKKFHEDLKNKPKPTKLLNLGDALKGRV